MTSRFDGVSVSGFIHPKTGTVHLYRVCNYSGHRNRATLQPGNFKIGEGAALRLCANCVSRRNAQLSPDGPYIFTDILEVGD